MFSKVKCKVLHLGQANPGYQSRLGDEQIHSSSAEKDLGVLVDARLDVSWQCAFAGQYPGLLKKQHDWQVQGHDSPPLLHCGDTVGVLHSVQESSAQESQGSLGASPEEATKIIRKLPIL